MGQQFNRCVGDSMDADDDGDEGGSELSQAKDEKRDSKIGEKKEQQAIKGEKVSGKERATSTKVVQKVFIFTKQTQIKFKMRNLN